MINHTFKIILPILILLVQSPIFAFGEEDDISRRESLEKLLRASAIMQQTQPLKPGDRAYLDSLESGQFISVYEYPGVTWKGCNEMQKKHDQKFIDCEAIGWLDRNSFVFTLKDQSHRIITETRDEVQLEFVYDEQAERKYVVPKSKKVSYSKIYFKYSRKVKQDGVDKVFDKEGIGWIPTELLSSELHKPFYRTVTPTSTSTSTTRFPTPAPSPTLPPATTLSPAPGSPVKSDSVMVPKKKPSIPEVKSSPKEIVTPPIKNKPTLPPTSSKQSRRSVPTEPILHETPVVSKEMYSPQIEQQAPTSSAKGAIAVTPSISNMESYLDAVDFIVDLLKPRLGVCIKPNFEKLSKTSYKNNYNPFDRLVLPKLNALDQDFIDYINENGSRLFLKEKVLLEDIVTIDALARTMYAEMGICYKNGLHYPMAVAKIALNRTRAEGRLFSSYTDEVPHHEDKSDLTKILTTPSQFNAWIPKTSVTVEGRRLETSAFKQVLCPPISGDKPFYTGSNPNINEQNVWVNSLRVATETVLFSEDFKKRTSNIRGDHYSSGLKKQQWHGMNKVYPSVEGRRFSNEGCMQIWVKKK